MTNENKKQLASTQAFLPIKEVRENTLIMKDNSLRAVVLVSSINFSLKSEDERNAIIMGYQRFLNSLDHPVQIVSISRKLNLDVYLNKVEALRDSQKSPLIRLQTDEYHKFIKELLEVSNIMEKKFFVVIPYYLEIATASKGALSSLMKPKQVGINLEEFETHRLRLAQRVESVINALTSMNLRAAQLGTGSLIELFYTIYNPETAGTQRIGSLADFSAPYIQSRAEAPSKSPHELYVDSGGPHV